MKRMFMVGLALWSAVAAAAIPRPEQVEGALANGNFGEARQMVQQVLAVHPDNARAHLINSFILAHADHNKPGATAELKLAHDLDKNGRVTGSELYTRTSNEIDAIKEALPQANVVVSMAPPPPPSSGFPWGIVMFLVLVGGLLWLWFSGSFRSWIHGSDRGPIVPPTPRPYTPPSGSSLPRSSNPSTTTTYIPPVYVPPTPSSVTIVNTTPAPVQNTILDTAVGTAAGVVAGELIADAITEPRTTRRRNRDRDDGWTSTPTPSVPDADNGDSWTSTPTPRYTPPSPAAAPEVNDGWSSTPLPEVKKVDDGWSSSPAPKADDGWSSSPAPAASDGWTDTSSNDSTGSGDGW